MFDFNLSSLKDKFFQKASNVVYDLQSGKIGLKMSDKSILTLQKEGESSRLVENPLDMSMSIPAFAIRTKTEDIAFGDFIVGDGFRGFFLGETDIKDLVNPAVSILKDDGSVVTCALPSNTVLGMDGILVVKNFFSNIGEGGFSSMLPLLLMSNKDHDMECNMDEMLPLLLMSGQGGGDMNQLLPLLLMSGEGFGSGGKMKNVMLMSMLTGGGKMDMSNPLMMMALLDNNRTKTQKMTDGRNSTTWKV